MFWKFGWADEFFKTKIYPWVEGEEYCEVDLERGYQKPLVAVASRLTAERMEQFAKQILDPKVEIFSEEFLNSANFDDVLDAMTEDEVGRIFRAYEWSGEAFVQTED